MFGVQPRDLLLCPGTTRGAPATVLETACAAPIRRSPVLSAWARVGVARSVLGARSRWTRTRKEREDIAGLFHVDVSSTMEATERRATLGDLDIGRACDRFAAFAPIGSGRCRQQLPELLRLGVIGGYLPGRTGRHDMGQRTSRRVRPRHRQRAVA